MNNSISKYWANEKAGIAPGPFVCHLFSSFPTAASRSRPLRRVGRWMRTLRRLGACISRSQRTPRHCGYRWRWSALSAPLARLLRCLPVHNGWKEFSWGDGPGHLQRNPWRSEERNKKSGPKTSLGISPARRNMRRRQAALPPPDIAGQAAQIAQEEAVPDLQRQAEGGGGKLICSLPVVAPC